MKKVAFILFSLVLTVSLFGQENKISIGLIGSFDKYWFDTHPSFVSVFDNDAASFGFNIQYNFTERLHVKSYFELSKANQELVYYFITLNEEPDPLIPGKTNLDVTYFGIPVLLGYYLMNNKSVKLSTSAGVVSEFLITDDEMSEFQDGSKKESEFLIKDLNRTRFSAQINVGLEYHFTKSLFMALEPYFRFGFQSSDNIFTEQKPFSFGGIVSINYKMLK